jgi:alkanesulfonate monooxygenase SsuD/methylene tetrahydromethanopterin reductase-like flavin-dependent oxidoreductase (luciferase family)
MLQTRVASAGPGLVGFRTSATSPPRDWQTLDAIWATAGELDVFDAGWMSDHLSDVGRQRGGPAFEAVAAASALAARVRGRWIGVAVFSNTFRHPAVLAKSAVMLDHITDGHFILGLGAGWHPGEHEAFGIELAPPRERFDRFESGLRVLRGLFSDEARTEPGVTLDDPYYPLRGATMEPAPVRRGGPPIWLGGQRRRGIELAARYADGWPMPGNQAGDVAYFRQKRDEIRRALERVGRDDAEFTFAAQVDCGTSRAERAEALQVARASLAAGAGHVILGVPGSAGPEALRAMAREVAEPLREAVARRR